MTWIARIHVCNDRKFSHRCTINKYWIRDFDQFARASCFGMGICKRVRARATENSPFLLCCGRSENYAVAEQRVESKRREELRRRWWWRRRRRSATCSKAWNVETHKKRGPFVNLMKSKLPIQFLLYYFFFLYLFIHVVRSPFGVSAETLEKCDFAITSGR